MSGGAVSVSPMSTDPELLGDTDDAADMGYFIQQWASIVRLQLTRLDDWHWGDAFLLIVAAHHTYKACVAFQVHDPSGEVAALCETFTTTHSELPIVRNVIMHFDEYYRGRGRLAPGDRVFMYSHGKIGGDWHASFGSLVSCNISKLGRDVAALAEAVHSARGPVDAWIQQMLLGSERKPLGTLRW